MSVLGGWSGVLIWKNPGLHLITRSRDVLCSLEALSVYLVQIPTRHFGLLLLSKNVEKKNVRIQIRFSMLNES